MDRKRHIGGELEFSDSFRSLSPWLKRRLNSQFGGSRHDVEDLVQESFIRFGRYPADARTHPRALLLRIAGNVARDAFRRDSARQRTLHVSIEDATLERVGDEADQHATAEVKEMLLDLPVHLRDVFLLARFSPMTNAEIARRLGISVKTVEWRLAKAMAFCLDRLRD